MKYKKRNLNISLIVLVICTIACLVASGFLSVALFRKNKQSATQLDIEPIVISGPLLKTYSANFNAEMIGNNILANDISFIISDDFTGSAYLRAAIIVNSNNTDIASSTQLQDSFLTQTTGSYNWVWYKDYYYLFDGAVPAKLSSSNAGLTIPFLDEDSLKVPDFISSSFFDGNSCSVDFSFEAINSSLFVGDAVTASNVESISSTPSPSQTHSVVFYNLNGEVLTTNASIVHGGTVTPPDISTLNIPPAYEFVAWNTQIEGRGATLTTAKLNNIVMDVNAYPIIRQKTFTVTINQSANGTISPATTVVFYGESLNIFFTADIGYQVGSVWIDGVDEGNFTSYLLANIVDNHIVSATFEERHYIISVDITGNGTATPEYQSVSKIAGETPQTIIFTPDTGCLISSITVDGTPLVGSYSLNQSTTYTVSFVADSDWKDVNIQVVFQNGLFSIDVTQIPNCSITPSITNIPLDDTRTITATPYAGYRLKKLIVDGVEIEPTVAHGLAESFVFELIRENHTFSAQVERNVYVLSVSVYETSTGKVNQANNSATASTGYSVELNPNATSTVYLFPNTGYEVDKVSEDDNFHILTPSQTSFTTAQITEDKTLEVYYKRVIVNVYATLSQNGQITQSNIGTTSVIGPATENLLLSGEYNVNQAINFVITPDNGYKIESISLTNVDSSFVYTITGIPTSGSKTVDFGSGSTYKFTSNWLFTISFVESVFNLSVTSVSENTNGIYELNETGGVVNGDGLHNYNSSITLTIVPTIGFEFVGYFTDSACTIPATVPAKMPAQNLIYFALFKRLTYILAVQEIYENLLNDAYSIGDYGGIGAEDKSYRYGEPIGEITTPVARTGFIYIPGSTGYFSDNLGDSEVAIPSTMPSNSIVVYAKFDRVDTTLTIDYNNGSQPAVMSGKFEQNLSLGNPAKTGYTFTHWVNHSSLIPSTSFNGSSTYVELGRDFMFTDKMTFVVVASMSNWSQFANGVMSIVSCTEDGGWNLTALGDYFQFLCYDSGVGYKYALSSIACSTLSPGYHTFIGTFDGINLKLYIDGTMVGTSLDFSSGSIGYSATNQILVGAEASSTMAPAGQYFNGNVSFISITNSSEVDWAEYNGTNFVFGASDSMVRANYDINRYTLTINPNNGNYGGAFGTINVVQDYGTEYTLFSLPYNSISNTTNYLNPPSGKSFNKWQIDGELVINNIFFFDKNAVATAFYDDNATFNIDIVERYENILGNLQTGDVGGKVVGDGDLPTFSNIVLVNEVNDGFSFDGYYTDENCTTLATIPDTLDEDGLKFYAKFIRNTYTISFVVDCQNVNGTSYTNGVTTNESGRTTITTDGGSFSFNSSPLKFGAALSIVSIVNEGFSLFNDMIYPNNSFSQNQGVELSSIATIPARNTTFYVRYVRNTYTLTIKPNGGKYNNYTYDSIITKRFGDTCQVVAPVWVPAGEKRFVQWERTSDIGDFQAGEEILGAGTYTFGAGDEVFNAVWEDIIYYLGINPDGGTVDESAFRTAGQMASIRYIRDTLTNGGTANGANHWNEISAFGVTNTNYAHIDYGATSQNNNGFNTTAYLLNGVNDDHSEWNYGGMTSCYSQTIDLGQIREIYYITVWHYWDDNRTYYNNKLEVSVDGETWWTVFDGSLEGNYVETSDGHSIYLKAGKYLSSVSLNFINKTGYEASNWTLYTPSSGSITSDSSGFSYVFSGSNFTKPTWQPRTFVVGIGQYYENMYEVYPSTRSTYKLGSIGGTVSLVKTEDNTITRPGNYVGEILTFLSVDYGSWTIIPSPSEGFVFAGLFSDRNLNRALDTSFLVNSNSELYVKFDRMVYEITVDGNGGDYDSGSSFTIHYQQQINLSNSNAEYYSYQLLGWQVSEGAGSIRNDSANNRWVYTGGAGDATIQMLWSEVYCDIVIQERVFFDDVWNDSGSAGVITVDEAVSDSHGHLRLSVRMGTEIELNYTVNNAGNFSFGDVIEESGAMASTIDTETGDFVSGRVNGENKWIIYIEENGRYYVRYFFSTISVFLQVVDPLTGDQIRKELVQKVGGDVVDSTTSVYDIVNELEGWDRTKSLLQEPINNGDYWPNFVLTGWKCTTETPIFDDNAVVGLFNSSDTSLTLAGLFGGELPTNVTVFEFQTYWTEIAQVHVTIHTIDSYGNETISTTGGTVTATGLSITGGKGTVAGSLKNISFTTVANDMFFFKNYIVRNLHEYSLSGSAYTIDAGKGTKSELFNEADIDDDEHQDATYFIDFYFSRPVLLLVNGGNAVNTLIDYSSTMNSFTLNSSEPTTSSSYREFYYYSTNQTDSEQGQNGVRYDTANSDETIVSYPVDISEQVGPLTLYAIYLVPTLVDEDYIVVPKTTTILTNSGGNYAYNGQIKYVTLPRGLTKISSNAFKNETQLSGISMPVFTLTIIEDNAFYSSDNGVLNLTIPNSVENDGISANTFDGGLIKTLTIGTGIASVSTMQFNNSFNLEEFKVAEGHTTLMTNDGVLFSITENNDYLLIRCPINKNKETYLLPLLIDDLDVIGISGYSFAKCSKIINFEGDLEDVPSYAFESGVQNVKITSEDCIVVNSLAFFGEELKTLELNCSSSNNIRLKNQALRNCTGLITFSIVIPNGTFIMAENYSLSDRPHMNAIDNITGQLSVNAAYWDWAGAGSDVIANCSNLYSVYLEKALVGATGTNLTDFYSGDINGYKWYYYGELGTSSATDGTWIRLKGYYRCISPDFGDWRLNDVTYETNSAGNTVVTDSPVLTNKTIINYVGSKTTVTIPTVLVGLKSNGDVLKFEIKNVSSLTKNDHSCSLTNVTVPSGVIMQATSSTSCFGDYDASSGVSYKKSLSVTYNSNTIGDYAFQGCTGLYTITGAPNDNSRTLQFLSHITSIGVGVFQKCKNLKGLEFESSITIGDYCFNGCSSLLKIIFKTGASPCFSGANTFSGTTSRLVVYVAAVLSYNFYSFVLKNRGFATNTIMKERDTGASLWVAYYYNNNWEKYYFVFCNYDKPNCWSCLSSGHDGYVDFNSPMYGEEKIFFVRANTTVTACFKKKAIRAWKEKTVDGNKVLKGKGGSELYYSFNVGTRDHVVDCDIL